MMRPRSKSSRGGTSSSLPGGGAYPARVAREAGRRRGSPGARDRRSRRPGGGDRHRGDSPWLARPRPTRFVFALGGRFSSRHRKRLARVGRRGDGADLAMRDASVGVARRDSADPSGRDHRRRLMGDEPRRVPRPEPGSRSIWARARTNRRRRSSATRCNEAYLPGVELPARCVSCAPPTWRWAATISSAWPYPPARFPASWPPTASGSRARAGVLVLCRGLVPPLGSLPSAFVAERSSARAVAVLGGPAHADEVLEHGASVVLASLDRAFDRQLADALLLAGLDVTLTTDVTGVELAGCAKNAAALAAAAASIAGPECGRRRRRQGVRRDRRAGAHSRWPTGDVRGVGGRRRSRRYRRLRGIAQPPRRRDAGSGRSGGRDRARTRARRGGRLRAAARDVARDADLEAPALDGFAALVEGRIEPERWTATVTEPPAQAAPLCPRGLSEGTLPMTWRSRFPDQE